MAVGSTSMTVTWSVPVAVFPALSFAVHVTVVSPSANAAGASFVIVTSAAPEQLSVALAVDRKSVEEGKSVDLGGGRIIKTKNGASSSNTVTFCAHVEVVPAL